MNPTKPNNVTTWVPPCGPCTECKIALVAEQPGKSEIFHRPIPQPLVGPAGQELNKCFESVGIIRTQVYLTNVIKDLDRPLNEYIDLSKKVPAISPRGREYINMLKEELHDCSANVIVAMGGVALYTLASRRGITKWRGSVIESTLLPGRKIIPTLHTATILPPKNVYLNKHLITVDLRRAVQESDSPKFNYKLRNIRLQPTFSEALAFIDECIERGLQGSVIDYDIEIYNEEVSCISLAYSPIEVMCIPFVNAEGDYFDIMQEAFIWKKIALLLEDRSIRKRGQNISFDSHFLLRTFGIKAHSLDDTMVAQKTLFPDYPMGLDFICTTYTDIPYYKDEGKKWFKVPGEWKKLWNYNALDSIVCAEAGPKQLVDLERQDNREAYERQRLIIEPLVYMQERGVRVDVEGMRKESLNYERRIEEATARLRQLVGYDINPNSPKQLINYFYGERGLQPYKKRGGGITTDDTALIRLARKGVVEASIVREIREASKARSNYLNLEKVDTDRRIRCSYNPSGTRFSRISSSENIFGTGMNLQNWPHELLRFLLADEDYVLYTFDLSQAENRVVAYVGNVEKMVEAFETGKDVHRLTAGLIFGKPPDEISDEPGSSTIGGGKRSERFWGKKANHSLNYDEGYQLFSLLNELPETQGKWIVERYHAAYPEIRQNYHAGIRRQLAANRTLTNLFGRKTLFLGEWESRLFKAAYSCIPQGSIGDKINEHGLIYVYYNQNDFGSADLLMQVHDSFTFQIPLSVPWEEHARMLRLVRQKLETPLKYKDRTFVIPVDISMGLTFRKSDGIDFKKGKLITAEALKEAYETLCQREENLRIGLTPG